MSQEVSDKEVEASRKKVDSLNDKIIQAKTELSLSESARNNAVRKEHLDLTAQVLENELLALREQIKVSRDLPADEVQQPPEVSQPSADIK